jgi:hypothetical protein
MPVSRDLGFAVASFALLALASPGRAATPPPVRAPAVQAVVDCRKIPDATQRLACYDAAVTSLTEAERSGDLVSLDRQQRTTVRRQAFGLTLPTLSMFDRGDALNSIDETLASAREDAEGKWTFVMRDGAIWRQIDDETLSRDPHDGSAIMIRRASLGSFMLSVDGQPGVRAHRDN